MQTAAPSSILTLMQGGAATVAQQQGLLVPNGAAGSQSLSPSPGSFGSGNGAAPVYGSSASTNSPSYGSSTSSYSPPAYGSSGNSATPSYGASSGTPTYGSSGSTYSPVASSGSSASSVPGTVTTYNNGQTSGSTQQSNASGACYIQLPNQHGFLALWHLSCQQNGAPRQICSCKCSPGMSVLLQQNTTDEPSC